MKFSTEKKKLLKFWQIFGLLENFHDESFENKESRCTDINNFNSLKVAEKITKRL